MMEEVKKLIKSFRYAFEGIMSCVRCERNMRVHLVCCIYMFSFLGFSGFWELDATRWALLFVSCASVLMGELINTAVENAVDMVCKDKNDYAKRAKDAAAGAVLVAALFAVATGVAVLWQPKAFSLLFSYFRTHLPVLAIFLLSLVPAVLFILFGFGKKSRK